MIGRGEKVLLTCCRVEIASPGGTNGTHFQTTERAVGFSSAGDKSARTVQSVQPLALTVLQATSLQEHCKAYNLSPQLL